MKHRIGFAFHNHAFKISFISTREQHNSVATPPSSSSSLLFAQPSQPLLKRRTFLSSTTADGDVLDSTTSEVIGDDNIIASDNEGSEPDISISHTTHISNNEHLDDNNTELEHDDAYYDQLFDTLTENSMSKHNSNDEEVEDDDEEGEEIKLIDFIEQTVGIQHPAGGEDLSKEVKKKRGRDKPKEKDIVTFTVQGNEKVFEVGDGDDDDKRKEIDDKEEDIPPEDSTEEVNEEHDHSDIAFVFPSSIDIKSSPKTSSEVNLCTTASIMEEQPPPSVNEKKEAPYNVVCTHITADFDTLASAIGLAKLWSNGIYDEAIDIKEKDNPVYGPLPTYVVLPRGAHPDVQRFLSLHKHLFPIRSLKSLPGFTDNDLKKGNNNNNNKGGNGNGNTNPREGLQRVGLVDAQRRDRLGPADVLLPHAKLGVTIVDHHVDAESDIQETNNYVVENVGSVSTMIAERMRYTGVEITEAEATILALGIHSDTGSLVYDSTVCLFSCVLCYVPSF